MSNPGGGQLGLRILVVDDHENMRRSLRSILELQQGWTVSAEAADGREAITKAAETRPDVIVLDMAMPGMDGLTAAREILRATPAVPIVMHTLYDSADLRRRAAAIGIREVCSKGQVETLLKAVRTIAASLQAGNAGSASTAGQPAS